MKHECELTVVMPAYKEAENLAVLLPQLKNSLDRTGARYQIIVVDTIDEMDDTKSVCKSNGVCYVNREPTNTFGSAVRSGILHADGERILFMDSDGSHNPEFVINMFEHSREADVVIASRYVDSGDTDNPWHLVLMSRLLNLTFSVVLGLPCKDVSNSFKVYKSSDIKPLVLRCENFDIVEEILYKVYKARRGVTIKEVPFLFKKRMFGETKRNLVTFIATYIFTIVKLRFFV